MTDKQFDCEYCGAALPKGVDKNTRRMRSAHFMRHAAERQKEDSGVHFTVDKQPEALRLAADWSVLFKNGMLDAEDIQDITDEFRRLHALCDEMGEALGGVIRVADRATEEFDRARAVHDLWKESK